MMQELAFTIPVVDEAMGFAEIMKYVAVLPRRGNNARNDSSSASSASTCQINEVVLHRLVFDTAPAGHTLRFLSFPSVLKKVLGNLSTLGGKFAPMIQQVSLGV